MRKSILLLTITLFTFATTIHAQPDSLWSRTFGGEQSESCYSIIQTDDGDYVIAGHTWSFGSGYADMWLLKTDADGDSLWTRTFGARESDYCFSMIQTTDEGYALAGFTQSFGAGNRDMWLVKTNEDGDSLWSQTFGGENRDYCHSLIQTADRGYALAGYTASFGAGEYDMWLVKTDANGDSLWSRTFGGEHKDVCNSVIQTTDGGYILAGFTESFGAGEREMWLVRTDSDGDSLWSRTLGGEGWDECHSVIQTLDGGYALGGYTGSFGAGVYDIWLVRTDADGDSLWSRTFGGRNTEVCYSMIQTADGGYALTGYISFFGARRPDFWLLRIDADGDSLWSQTFGGRFTEWCNSIIQTGDGGYALAGWTASFGAGQPGRFDMWLVKTGPDPVSVPSESFIPHPSTFSLHPAYPNPFNSTTTIRYSLPFPSHVSLMVYNLSGQEITTLFKGYRQVGNHSECFNADNLPTGLYFVRLESANQSLSNKIMLIK